MRFSICPAVNPDIRYLRIIVINNCYGKTVWLRLYNPKPNPIA
jgi:hypothetical protein